MTGTGGLSGKLAESFYTEALLLADEIRSYFDRDGREERDILSPHGRVQFACESLKATTRLMNVIAWLATLSLEMVNEGLDARDWILWTGHVNWPETARDMVDTLLWPSILLAALCGAGGARLPLADIGGLQRTRPESPRSARTSAVTATARPRSPRDSAR